MFGLGVNNNGTALVLASVALSRSSSGQEWEYL
jgi:hypothetical protein